MKHCNHCGALIEDNARFCTSCGTPLEQSVQQVSHKTNWWIYIVGVIFILLIGLSCFIYFTKEKCLKE